MKRVNEWPLPETDEEAQKDCEIFALGIRLYSDRFYQNFEKIPKKRRDITEQIFSYTRLSTTLLDYYANRNRDLAEENDRLKAKILRG